MNHTVGRVVALTRLGSSFASKEVEVPREYRIFVDTSPKQSHETEGNIYMQLIGSKGNSGLFFLQHGAHPDERTEFSLLAPDIGQVQALRLAAQTKDDDDAWFCDRVWVQAPEGPLEFPIGRLVGTDSVPEVVHAPSMAAMDPSASLAVPHSRDGDPESFVVSNRSQLRCSRKRWRHFL